MDIETVKKKLREARFFLGRLGEQEGRAFGDKEPFDFYLSAFLNAGRTVGNRFNRMQQPAQTAWRKKWRKSLTPAESVLDKFFGKQRNDEVHSAGNARTEKTENIPVGHGYSDPSGWVYVTDPDGSDGAIPRPAYFFTIDGAERKATEACADYLALLERMVSEFVADNPS